MGLTPSPSRLLIMLAVRMQGEKRGRPMRVLMSLGAEQVTAMQSTEHLESDLADKEESKFPSTNLHPAHLHLLLAPHILLIVPPFPFPVFFFPGFCRDCS